MLQVSANDIDLEPVLKYTIVSGNNDNAFVINRQTGLLSVARALDYERLSSYQLTIQVLRASAVIVWLLRVDLDAVEYAPPQFSVGTL